MVKVYCDICGKQLKSDYSNVVNLDFNCYGTADFDKGHTYNLCKKCATKIKAHIDSKAIKEESEEEE